MMKLESKSVYGPVWSRRFGWDLGVNLLPVNRKLCTFDCVYCQYGFTPALSNQTDGFPQAAQIIKEWEQRLAYAAALRISIYHTTVSGNGEPTMHPQFGEIVEELCALRDEVVPGVPIAVLSNASMLDRASVREALMLVDERYMKLDAGDAATLRTVNGSTQAFDAIVEHLSDLQDIVVQAMFVKDRAGRIDNTSEQDVGDWVARVARIGPKCVHVYSLDRTPAALGLHKVDRASLERIASRLRAETGIEVTVY